MFSIRIHSNGEPSIHTTTGGIAGYHYHRNDGVDFTPNGGETVDSVREMVKSAEPSARVRIVSKGRTVRVRFPSALVAARDAIMADWQNWAAEGLSHPEMRHRAINHPAFAPYASR